MKQNLVLGLALGLLVLAIATGPAQGATDYQNGTAQGLFVGLKMGQLLGLAQSGNLTAADEYNSMIDKYNNGLAKIFPNDTAILEAFRLPKINTSYIKDLKAQGLCGEEISRLLC